MFAPHMIRSSQFWPINTEACLHPRQIVVPPQGVSPLILIWSTLPPNDFGYSGLMKLTAKAS
jgi:hypothetical protein